VPQLRIAFAETCQADATIAASEGRLPQNAMCTIHFHSPIMPLRCTLSIGLVMAGLLSAAGADSGLDEPLRRTIDFEGSEREYFVRLPAKYREGKTYWLLVSVHGGGGNGRRHFLSTGIRRAADRIGLDAILVSPSFSNADFQASRFPILGEGRFLISVLEDLRGAYQLQPKILLTGYSRGGQFSHRFAFRNPKLVEAVAPFAAGTWTTPGGALLIESFGKVDNSEVFLSDRENRSLVTQRLHSTCR